MEVIRHSGFQLTEENLIKGVDDDTVGIGMGIRKDVSTRDTVGPTVRANQFEGGKEEKRGPCLTSHMEERR